MNKQQKLYLSIGIVFLIFAIATFYTPYYGETDTGSFTSVAKYFGGSYNAKIRSSHSYLWGFVNFPLVELFQSFIGFKIFNLIVLMLIILSVYYISNKKKTSLMILIFTPIIWYMAPYINSIQIASLFFLWSYYFIQKYEEKEKLINLFSSGMLFGLAGAFWHAIFFFGVFLVILFFIAVSFVVVIFANTKVHEIISTTALNESEAYASIDASFTNINDFVIQRGLTLFFATLIIGILVSSFLVRVHPIFIFIYIMTLLASILTSVYLANAFAMVVANGQLAAISDKFATITFMMKHVTKILLAVGAMSMIIIFGKIGGGDTTGSNSDL